METFNPDPKPGRIVLPLVLIGMIATTYTFINRVATNNDLDIVVEDTTVQLYQKRQQKIPLQLQPLQHCQMITFHILRKLMEKG